MTNCKNFCLTACLPILIDLPPKLLTIQPPQSLSPPTKTFLVNMSLSLVSGKLGFLHDGYIVAIGNCCVAIAVKCTLFPTCIASLLLGISFTIANTRDCTSQMPKMCYCGLQSSRRICKYVLITPLLTHILFKETYIRRGMVTLHFLQKLQL